MQEQLQMLQSHLVSSDPLEPLFIREHAMIVVQMAEVLLEPDERLVRFDPSGTREPGGQAAG
jgi:hypothetical protein